MSSMLNTFMHFFVLKLFLYSWESYGINLVLLTNNKPGYLAEVVHGL